MKFFIDALSLLLVAMIIINGNAFERHLGQFAELSISSIGGNTACVVTGNKLFANGLFVKDLNGEEQEELMEYSKAIKDYKQEVKRIMKSKHNDLATKKDSEKITELYQSETPKLPKKPSFCALGDVTQYYFNGCMVQNNKVYIGHKHIRDLTPEEVDEMKQFDIKMTAYQKYLDAKVRQQMDSIFGGQKDIWTILFDPSKEQKATTQETTVETTPITPVEIPTAPDFCIAIY